MWTAIYYYSCIDFVRNKTRVNSLVKVKNFTYRYNMQSVFELKAFTLRHYHTTNHYENYDFYKKRSSEIK